MVADGVLLSTAMEFLSRQSTTSEVLTLNITNLVILLVIKAAIFAFGLFASGSATARSSQNALGFSETDLTGGMCFLMFTSGAEEKLSCIKRAACNDVETADAYYKAGKLLYQAQNVLGVPISEKYYTALEGVNEARQHAEVGGDCTVYEW